MAPPAKRTIKAVKATTKTKLTGTSSSFKNASVEEKVSLWNGNGGGLYGSQKATNDDATSHQDVIVTILSDSDDTASTKSSKKQEALTTKVMQQKNDSAKELTMSGALSPSKGNNGKENNDEPAKLYRQRSASTPNIVLVEPSTPTHEKHIIAQPVSAPGRPHMMVRRKYKAPPPSNKLDEELKKASAPPRRVISDGKWVRHRRREPDPEPEPEPAKKVSVRPKPAKVPELKLGWVRPPLITRKDPNDLQPTKQLEVVMPQMPPIRTLTGKLKKPILHQFVPGAKSGRLNPGVVPGSAAQRAAQQALLERTVQYSGSDSDAITDLSDETESAQTSPRARVRKRSSKHNEDIASSASEAVTDDELVNRQRERSKPAQSANNRKSGQQYTRSQSEKRLTASDGLGRKIDVRQVKSDSRRRAISHDISMSRVKSEEKGENLKQHFRKGSYNTGDKVPILTETTNAVNAAPTNTPNKVSSWLTATLDPFIDRMKSSRSKSSPTAKADADEVRHRDCAQSNAQQARARSASRPLSESQRTQRVYVDSDCTSAVTELTLNQQDTITDVSYSDQSEQCSSAASTPTLKRSGAKRVSQSPVKHRRTPSTLADTESSISESVTASSLSTTSVTESNITDSHATGSSREANSDFHDPTRREVTTLALKNKAFPSTGRRLSTIASVETLSTHVKRIPPSSGRPEQSQRFGARGMDLQRSSQDPNPLLEASKDISLIIRKPSQTNTLISRRSTRSHRARGQPSVMDMMRDIAEEEAYYMPELRTLVGGVIKVLFRAVLSKSDAAIAAGLFSPFAADGGEKEATKMIHEMGVALERLKSYHNRIPKTDSSAFLIWASGAHKIYAEYVRTWKLGFQNVVVSLVPADDMSMLSGKDLDGSSLANALPRNIDGYVVDDQGQLVDVAYLLKRPLIRLKGLTKSIKGLTGASPSGQTEELLEKYERLMNDARHKVNQEKARIEDQMAAQIDVSRVRDPTSLGALAGVKIDPTRCVRARDNFEMHMIHSSGQEIISKVELLLRDDATDGSPGGDVLICQSDGHQRWLLLPPILLAHISARSGKNANELVVMLRGVHSHGRMWQELLQLVSKEADDAKDWLEMLGSSPVPTEFSRTALVLDSNVPRPIGSPGSFLTSSSYITGSDLSRLIESSAPSGIEVPLGEKNAPTDRLWSSRYSPTASNEGQESTFASLRRGSPSARQRSSHADVARKGTRVPVQSVSKSHESTSGMRASQEPDSSPGASARASPWPSHRPAVEVSNSVSAHEQAKQRHDFAVPEEVASPSRTRSTARSVSGSSGFSVWMPSTQHHAAEESDSDEEGNLHFVKPYRPIVHHSRSASLPTTKVPAYCQQRRSEGRDESRFQQRGSVGETPIKQPGSQSACRESGDNVAPRPPPHRTPIAKKYGAINSDFKLTPDSHSKSRSSSPLKHSWRPESDHEVLDEESSASDNYDDIATSDSDSDGEALCRVEEYHATRSIIQEASSEVTDDITPSQSASQAPFRDVPAPEEIYLTALASVSTWNATEYKSIHDDECLIEIGPGKISAYETITDHNAPVGYQTRKKPYAKPVAALALTPHVLIQVLNVHDVLISSIPSWDSRFQPPRGQKLAKVRFHTRHQIHRQRMVEAIQTAMQNNPVYQRLERDRPKETAAEMFDRQNPGEIYRQEKQRSWFGGSRRAGSFRKSNTGAGSTVGNTEYSGRTTSSIRRGIQAFFDKTTNFNIDKSTLFRRSGDGHTSARERDLGSSAPRDAFACQSPGEMNQVMRSTHCSAVRWDKSPGGSRQARRLGKVTLHILHAPRGPLGGVHGIRGPDGIHSGEGHRLVIANEVGILLDRVLPPACFVMDSRGIVVHVFDQKTDDGRVASTGGVGTLTTDLYCLTSFPNETMRDWLFMTLSRPVGLPG